MARNNLARIAKLEEATVSLSKAAVVTFTDLDTSSYESYTDGIFRVDGKLYTYEELHHRFKYLVFIPEKDSEQ